MAFDEGLAQRIRDQLAPEGANVVEKKMFGGTAFMLSGNLLVGVMGDDLICRVGPGAMDQSLAQPGARIFDFSSRPMKGWVIVAGDAVTEDGDLAAWIERARAFVTTLPAK